jgi:hypothetical protein
MASNMKAVKLRIKSVQSTDLLSQIPGALLSIGRNSFVSIGPAPSIGCPSAFTTRPTMASPTGTDTTLPVRFTV